MLYIIGLGLGNEKDITVKGLEAVRKCDKVYLDNYTSKLQCSYEDLERFYLKKITLANRETAEQGAEKIVEEAATKNIAFLIIGDPFSATTHVELFRLAKEKGVEVDIINNASIITAVGRVGLEIYKYGKTISIPFKEYVPHLETPYMVLRENSLLNMHTLCLLDLHPEKNKFMTIKEAIERLEEIEKVKQEGVIQDNLLVIGCARIGSDNIIKVGKLAEIKNMDFGQPPYCLIFPAKMHFMEEEMLKLWKVKKEKK